MAALAQVKERYIPKENSFYRKHYAHFIMGLMVMIVLLIGAIGMVLYQMQHRPLPIFNAVQPSGQTMLLTAFEEPNLLPDTILRWANKAATLSYNFDFIHYNAQVDAARPFFTEAGWNDYIGSVRNLINMVIKNRLVVNGVVAGTPVIANQGELPGLGYVWRVQIPFLVSYQVGSVLPTQRNYYVILSIVRVPTTLNPQGIGIDQFVMVPR